MQGEGRRGGGALHSFLVVLIHLGTPKVSHNQVALRINQKILGFEVSMYYAPPVEVLEGQYDLPRVDHACVVVKWGVMLQHVEKLTTWIQRGETCQH